MRIFAILLSVFLLCKKAARKIELRSYHFRGKIGGVRVEFVDARGIRKILIISQAIHCEFRCCICYTELDI